MPGIVEEGSGEGGVSELNGHSSPSKENAAFSKSPNGTSGVEAARSTVPHPPVDGVADTSIEQLYENVCDMESSDQSPSRNTYGSDGEESRIDSELQHLVGGEMKEVQIMEEEIAAKSEDDGSTGSKKASSAGGKKAVKTAKSKSASTKSGSSISSSKASRLPQESEASPKSNAKGKSPLEKSLIDKKNEKPLGKQSVGVTSKKKPGVPPAGGSKSKKRIEKSSELGNPDLGPFLLKQARDLITSDPEKALELALRSAKSFEICSSGKPNLEYVMCLHVTAAIYCSLGQYNEAIPVLERSINIPVVEEGQDDGLAKFAGYMQLGDTYAMLGQLENAIECYTAGLEVQKQMLGETDPRVGETCRYLAEAHVQALQFDEAERVCQMALDIHKENGSATLEEAADRRLMGLICDTKGDHEAGLEHLVLASMAMVANGQEAEVASVDCGIGDIYLSLSRYDEAVFAYQKALAVFKTTKGENHPAVGSVFVRLAELYNRTGKIKESKSYCENALRIYEKAGSGVPPEEIASGLTDVSAIYESMNELEQAIKLLQKALKIYNDAPGQQTTIAGIEAQMGVMYYMLGNYSASYDAFKNSISKLRASGDKKSAFLGIALNQMGLACVQRYALNEAIELFEEARTILEQEYGPYHPDTLGVYSNLAGTYDAVGRMDDAIEILDYVVGMREDKLGTANPDVDDEKRRLAELLKEGGRVRNRKAKSLEHLLDANGRTLNNVIIKA